MTTSNIKFSTPYFFMIFWQGNRHPCGGGGIALHNYFSCCMSIFLINLYICRYISIRMKLTRTAKIKLNISANELLPTLIAYTKAFNFVCQKGFDKKEKNGINLHKLCYYDTREYLPSQLAISARMKATEALKGIFAKTKKYTKCPKSILCSARYDKNSYT